MNHERPAKRIRQACEQCRRKKSKCSGQRPVCSTCWRLEQQCYYYGEPLQPAYDYSTSVHSLDVVPHIPAPVHAAGSPHNLDDRMVTLESTMSRILDTLQSNGTTNHIRNQDQSSPCARSVNNSTVEIAAPSLPTIISGPLGSRQISLTRKGELERIGKAYVTFCADQPLPLFPRDGFVESLLDRADVTLFAIIANALRYTSDTQDPSCSRDSGFFRDAAHSRIMADVGEGNVGISTLQALCLIVLFDFATGRMKTASSLMALASMLAPNVDFRANPPALRETSDEEGRCCYWSIILLRRLLGITTPLATAPDVRLLPYPRSCSMPTGSVLRPEVRQAYEHSMGDNGVMVFVIEMSEEWVKVMSYVRHCLSFTTDASPWLTTSRYAAALAGVMSIETRLQPLHRYKHVAFRDLTLENLEECRQYWAPWLLSRFLYHTMVCLLNHPLLITLQLQAKGNDSELFRQQSSFYVARHVHWILHFIAFIEARKFRITDPILGYCAAVVATIESQLIYSVDEATAQKKRRNIESCRRLIRSLVPAVPSMTELVGHNPHAPHCLQATITIARSLHITKDRKLGALSEVISTTYASNMNNAASVAVDLSRIRNILDICPPSFVEPSPRPNDQEHAPQTTVHSGPSQSQWVRLSRRPSVDQPDESGSPVQDERQIRPQGSVVTPLAVVDGIALQETSPDQGLTASVESTGFPADLFFNGISQDVSSWWNAFDTYDPDCPSF